MGRGFLFSNFSCCYFGVLWLVGGVWFVGCEGGRRRVVCTWELCVLESRFGGFFW